MFLDVRVAEWLKVPESRANKNCGDCLKRILVLKLEHFVQTQHLVYIQPGSLDMLCRCTDIIGCIIPMQEENKKTSRLQLHCWCNGIMEDSHSFDPGSIPGQCTTYF